MRAICLLLALAMLVCSTVAVNATQLHLLKLPSGFHVKVYADNLPYARAMDISPKGNLFVGSLNIPGDTAFPSPVYALVFDNKKKTFDKFIIDETQLFPAGVQFYNNDLYVAAYDKIVRYSNIEQDLANPPNATVVLKVPVPPSIDHSWKYLRIDKATGDMYFPIGSPCNNCTESLDGCYNDEKPCIYGTLYRLPYATYANATDLTIDAATPLAHGIRNTVGFDWHPQTGDLWFSDNGRDMWSEDQAITNEFPPDEINRIVTNDTLRNFGFPWCYGAYPGLHDPTYPIPNGQTCDEAFDLAQVSLQAHVAPLGLRFYTGKMFPKKYQNALILAEHGSWDAAPPHGYRVVVFFLTAQGNNTYSFTNQTLIDGFLQIPNNASFEIGPSPYAIGRPADIFQLPDGSLLVSDDQSGAIYRVSYSGHKQNKLIGLPIGLAIGLFVLIGVVAVGLLLAVVVSIGWYFSKDFEYQKLG